MPTRFSEKYLILGLICFAAGVFLLLYTRVFALPVRISEKGILSGIASCMLFFFSKRLFKRAAIKA